MCGLGGERFFFVFFWGGGGGELGKTPTGSWPEPKPSAYMRE